VKHFFGTIASLKPESRQQNGGPYVYFEKDEHERVVDAVSDTLQILNSQLPADYRWKNDLMAFCVHMEYGPLNGLYPHNTPMDDQPFEDDENGGDDPGIEEIDEEDVNWDDKLVTTTFLGQPVYQKLNIKTTPLRSGNAGQHHWHIHGYYLGDPLKSFKYIQGAFWARKIPLMVSALSPEGQSRQHLQHKKSMQWYRSRHFCKPNSTYRL
jgi:hypothetical protein